MVTIPSQGPQQPKKGMSGYKVIYFARVCKSGFPKVDCKGRGHGSSEKVGWLKRFGGDSTELNSDDTVVTTRKST